MKKSRKNRIFQNIYFGQNLGEQIRQIRLGHPDPECRTQVGFAHWLGISQGSLSKLEHGKMPDNDTLRNIARAGGISVDQLLAEAAPSAATPPEFETALTPAAAFTQIIQSDPVAQEVLRRHLRSAVEEIEESPRPEKIRGALAVQPPGAIYPEPESWCEIWEPGLLPMELLAEAFPEAGSVVLDVGSGSGGNAATLLDLGYNAFGVEPSAGLREQALRLHPELHGRLEERKTPGLGRPYERLFDGVLCANVLQSIEREQLIQVGLELKALLRPGGRLLVTIPQAPLPAPRGQAPESYFPTPSDGLRFLFECLGFRFLTLDKPPAQVDSAAMLLFELRSP